MEKIIQYCKVDFELSEYLVDITLGFDNFYRSNSKNAKSKELAREGLVPVNLTNKNGKSYSDYESIKQDYFELYSKVNSINNEIRREYLAKQISSMIFYIDFLTNEQIPYRDKVKNLLHVDSNPINLYKIKNTRTRLEQLLLKAGYKGSLEDMYTEWHNQRKVPANEIEGVLNGLLLQAREDVFDSMFKEVSEIDAKPKVVSNVPYSAYADYLANEMIINGDYSYTFEDLKHLVTHEVFPGHFTHLKLREIEMNKGNIPLDAGLVITNTASSPIFEGIADCGQYFIDWYKDIDDDIAREVQQLKSMTTLNVGYQINELGSTFEEISNYLKEYAFGQDKWIESRYNFLTDFIRGPFIYAYYRGYEGVKNAFEYIQPKDLTSFYNLLYKNMISTDELKIF